MLEQHPATAKQFVAALVISTKRSGLKRVLKVLNPEFYASAAVAMDAGGIALHYAVASGAPVSVLQALVNAHPGGLGVRNGVGQTPHALASSLQNFPVDNLPLLRDPSFT